MKALPRTSLRARLFLGLGGLMVLLMLAQLWLVRSLTRDLASEVDNVALFVGSEVANIFTYTGGIDGGGEPPRPGRQSPSPVAERTAREQIFEDASRLVREVRLKEVRLEEMPLEEMPLEEMQLEEVQLETEGRSEVWIWPSTRSTAQASPERASPGRESSETASGDGADAPSDALAGDSPMPTGAVQVRTLRVPAGPRGSSLGARLDGARVQLGGDLDSRVLRLEMPGGSASVPIPRLGLRERIERFQQRLWLGSGLLLTLGLLVAGLLAHRVSTPLADLADVAERVGGGELGAQVAAGGGGREVRRTQEAFNAMSTRLEVLARRNRRLEGMRQLEEIGDIARGLAHSLRNPLNALGLSVQDLAGDAVLAGGSDADGGRRARLAETASRQIRRLDAGIRSFLVLASPGVGGAEPVALDELVRDVALEALQDSAGRVGLDVDIAAVDIAAVDIAAVDEEAGHGEAVHTESHRWRMPAVAAELRAVVQALVVNAVEASPDGGRVRVRLRPGAGDELVLEVEDRGPGLPRSVRERLFTPHVSTKPSGSGMGLFLAHRIVGFRYGGRLELLDRDGGGTLARLTIGPRRDVDPSPPQTPRPGA